MSKRPLALVVLGSHRSGTSVLTRALSELGATIPDGLLEASEDNPDGYFESRRIVQLNNELLGTAGLSWFHDAPLPQGFLNTRAVRRLHRRALEILREEFQGSSAFALKDPRLSRLVPFWARALADFGADPHWILMLRHPLEVASSLERRKDMPAQADAAVTAPDQALLLWLRYTLEAERETRTATRTLIAFEDLLADWRSVMVRVTGHHPERLASWLSSEGASSVDRLITPGRKRTHAGPAPALAPAQQQVISLCEGLVQHARGLAPLPEEDLARALSGMDDAQASYSRLRQDGARVRTDDPWGPQQLRRSLGRQVIQGPPDGTRLAAHTRFHSGAPDSRSFLYRVRNHTSAIEAMGARATLGGSPLEGNEGLLLHRAPWTPEVADLVEQCRAGGRLVGLDIDDLLFDPARMTPEHFRYLEKLDAAERHSWVQLAEDLRETLLAVDYVVTPTEALAAEARAAGARAFVIRNALGREALARARTARLARRLRWRRRGVRIGYASGTPTHGRDFRQAAGAVARVLADHPSASFVAVGFLDLEDHPELAPHRSRIECRPLVPHHLLPRELARFDINLAPLEAGNPFCEAKSELKYFEAGVLGIPTIASRTGAFEEAIEDGLNGRLVDGEAGWTEALLGLVASRELRQQQGELARRHAMSLYGPEETRRQVANLQAWLQAGLPES